MNSNIDIESQTLINILMARVNALTSDNIIKDSAIETLNMQLIQYRNKEVKDIDEGEGLLFEKDQEEA